MAHRFRKGDLIRAVWDDPAGTIGEPKASAGLMRCVTYGIVESRRGHELVLWTSRYDDDESGDRCTLNTGCITEWRTIATREELKNG